jgi:antitoxin FitA
VTGATRAAALCRLIQSRWRKRIEALVKGNPTAACFVDMRSTCFNVRHMTAMIQIRNVPDALHRRLKSRAALAGMSLSDYLLGELREVAERPTVEELRSRLERRSRVIPSIAPADAVRAERERQ